MSLSDIQDSSSIRQAIAEFDQIGRHEFLSKYAFKPARSYFIVEGDKRYDSKAIVGAAHGYEFPDQGPLRAEDFSGGEATVKRKLTALGFTVEKESHANRPIIWSMNAGDNGQADELFLHQKTLAIEYSEFSDFSNLGNKRPAFTAAVSAKYPEISSSKVDNWAGHPYRFIHVMKTGEFVVYPSKIDHRLHIGRVAGPYFYAPNDEYADFPHRRHVDWFKSVPIDAFSAEARSSFRGQLTIFTVSLGADEVLDVIRSGDADNLAQLASEIEATEPFDPSDLEDGRERIKRDVVRRQGQKSFRDALLKAYGGHCCITGCDVEAVLEAAHIIPYMGNETNHVQNGLLLRADIHTLFDLGFIGIDPGDFTVVVSPKLKGTEYEGLRGQKMQVPVASAFHPNSKALSRRLAELVKHSTP